MSFQEIELARIKPNPANPRKHFDGKKFDELMASIRIKGVLQPIVIRPKEKEFEIVAGERRWRAACKIAEENGGLQDQKIPAMVRQLTDDEAFDVMCIENLQREDLTEREEADSFKAFLARKGDQGLPELAERTGIDPRYIRRRIRVLTLPAPILDAWQKGTLRYGHLEQLRRLEDEKEILVMFKEITRHHSYWEEDGISAWPVSLLKSEIDGKAIDLKGALFDKKGCKACGKNSAVQKELFGLEDLNRANCLDRECFKKKQNDWLMANWKKTAWAKKDKTNGFRLGDNLTYRDYEGMYGEVKKECLQCENFVSRIPLDRSSDNSSQPVCLDNACFRKVYRNRAARESGKTKDEYRAHNHGEQFRESFYAERLPLAVAEVPADDTKSLRLALVAMIHKDHELVEWFAKNYKAKKGKMVGYWYQSAPELWAVVKDMDIEQILKAIQGAALQISLQPGYGANGRHMTAQHFGIDLSKQWRMTEDYLKAKTIKEILATGKKLGFWQDKKAQDYLYEKLGKKRGDFESCRKTDLIKIILKSGMDLAGKVPEEIVKVEK